jgi:hypothetical protein
VAAFLAQKAAGTTTTQTVGAVLAAATTATPIASAGNGFVDFGDTLLIRHLDTNAAVCSNPSPLAANPSRLTATAAPDAAPTLRSAFTVTGSSATEGVLRYNQDFYLQCSLPEGGRGYLTSERLSISSGAARYSGKQLVFVAKEDGPPSFDAAWMVLPAVAADRFEQEGQPVPANTKVVIRHARTGLNLAVLKQHVWRHEFGADFEVVAHSFLTAHKADGAENLFQLEEQA